MSKMTTEAAGGGGGGGAAAALLGVEKAEGRGPMLEGVDVVGMHHRGCVKEVGNGVRSSHIRRGAAYMPSITTEAAAAEARQRGSKWGCTGSGTTWAQGHSGVPPPHGPPPPPLHCAVLHGTCPPGPPTRAAARQRDVADDARQRERGGHVTLGLHSLRCRAEEPPRGVWCGVVWCGVVWCGVVWCGVCVWGGEGGGGARVCVCVCVLGGGGGGGARQGGRSSGGQCTQRWPPAGRPVAAVAAGAALRGCLCVAP